MKLPAESKILRWDESRTRDRAALNLLRDRGEAFTVPAFCAAYLEVVAAEQKTYLLSA